MAGFMDQFVQSEQNRGNMLLAIAQMKRADEDRKIRNEQNALAQMLSGLQIRELMRKQQEDEATKRASLRAFSSWSGQSSVPSYPAAPTAMSREGQARNVAGIQETPLYSGDASTVKLARTPEFERFARSLRDQIPGTTFVPSGNEIQVIPPQGMNPDDFDRQMRQIASGQGLTTPSTSATQQTGQYPEIDQMQPTKPDTVTPARIPPGMQGTPSDESAMIKSEIARLTGLAQSLESDPQATAENRKQAQAYRKQALDYAIELKKLSASDNKDYTLGPGQQRFDGQGKVIAEGPPKTADTVVNLENKQESEFAKTVGKGFGEEYLDLQKSGKDALTNTARYERAKSLVTKLSTGATAPTVNSIKAVIKSLGFDPEKYGMTDNVGLAEALESVAVDLTMDAVSRTKGAVTEKEMELFAQTAPGLSKTVEGNLLIIDMAQTLNRNKIRVAELARKYMQKNGKFDEGFYDELEKFHAENPLFTEAIYKRVNNLTGAAGEARKRGGVDNYQSPDFSKMSNEELRKYIESTK